MEGQDVKQSTLIATALATMLLSTPATYATSSSQTEDPHITGPGRSLQPIKYQTRDGWSTDRIINARRSMEKININTSTNKNNVEADDTPLSPPETVTTSTEPTNSDPDVYTRFNTHLVPKTVGILTSVRPDGSNWACTASVVNTPKGNVIHTAAHCVFTADPNKKMGKHTEFHFIPAYFEYSIDGEIYNANPYGDWEIYPGTEPSIMQGWVDGKGSMLSREYDHAFLTMKFIGEEPSWIPTGSLKEKVGSNGLRTNSTRTVGGTTIIGYPGNMPSPRYPYIFQETYTPSSHFNNAISANNARLSPGSSGGPWWINSQDENGERNSGTIIATTSADPDLDGPEILGSGVSDAVKNLYQYHVLVQDK